MDLKNFYNNLKNEKDKLDSGIKTIIPSAPINTPAGSMEWKRSANDCAKQLTDNCRKHIILDMYCKILPLDDDYIQGNIGTMKADIDTMLINKGMTATQYLQSCADNTKSPLCEYVLKMTDLIGKQYLEEANEKLEDAKLNDINLQKPEVPDHETDEQITSSLVDIEDDISYQTVMDKLEQQTKNTIVEQISKLLTDKKQSKDMEFDLKNGKSDESTMESAVNYIQSRLMKENVNSNNIMDDVMGLAIREATINILNECFQQPKTDVTSFKSRIKFGKGNVITESAISSLIETAKSTEEVDKIINDADEKKKKDIDNKLNASDVVNAEEEKKKQTRLEREEGL